MAGLGGVVVLGEVCVVTRVDVATTLVEGTFCDVGSLRGLPFPPVQAETIVNSKTSKVFFFIVLLLV